MPAKRTQPASVTPPRSVLRGVWRNWWLPVAAFVGVAACTATVHWPVLHAQALTFDDQQYVTYNPLVRTPSLASAGRFLGEIWHPSTVRGYYQPLTMISLMVDYALGGRPHNAFAFHRTSLLLHVANTLLIVLLLYQLCGRLWIAALVGLLFGVHPLTVEPIVWLGERKTMLATCGALASLVCYVSYVRCGGRWRYIATTVLFVLALLAKPTALPLPIVMLLLDYWPLNRLTRRAVTEKLPWLGLAMLFALVAFVSQRNALGVILPYERPASWIPLTVAHNLVFYPAKMLWPRHLSPFYGFPEPFGLTQPAVLAGVIGAAVLLTVVLISWRWTRTLVVGWAIFLAAIFPTLGVVGVSGFIASDKYAYLPALGFLLVIAFALRQLVESNIWRRQKALRVGGTLCLLALTAAAAATTRHQLAYWRTTESLYDHMLALAPNEPKLHCDLGNELLRLERVPDALRHFATAVQLAPDLYDAQSGLGEALRAIGKLDDAVPYFERAQQLDPRRPDAYVGLGALRAQQGQRAQALELLNKALAIDPNIAVAHKNIGVLHSLALDFKAAIPHLRRAVELAPENARFQQNLAVALLRSGQSDEAIRVLRDALRADPQFVPAYAIYGGILLQRGQHAEAAAMFEAGLRFAPNDANLQEGLRRARGAPPTNP